MSFVNHNGSTRIFLLQLNNLRQGSQVSFHGEDTVNDNKLHTIFWATFQQRLKLFHIVVLVLQAVGEAIANAVHDAGVVAVVTDNVVVAVGQHTQHTAIYGETGRKTHGLILTHEFGQLLLQLHMQIQRSVEETGTCTTATVLFHGFDSSLNNALIARQSRVGIRAEHQHAMTFHNDFSTLLTLNLTEIRVNAHLLILLRTVVLSQSVL